MDAWDLVMRALSHYWRVTRQDNVVAQALLEKAITIDPNYGQALGRPRHQLYFQRPHGLGGQATVVPSLNVRRLRRSRPTARTPGRTTRLAACLCSRGALKIRWPSSSWRCG